VSTYVLSLHDVDATQGAAVGGKGANLGELGRIDGIRVPPGFCVTTDAYRRFVAGAPSIDEWLDRLVSLDPAERESIAGLSSEIRGTLEAVAVPDDVSAAITDALIRLGEYATWAVRSSATA
jgi:pyruvate,water dikinase